MNRVLALAILFGVFLSTAFAQNSQTLLPNGVVLNEYFSVTPNGAGRWYNILIASLAPSSGGSYDHIHILATLNTGDAAWQNSFLDANFGNRNGFQYTWALRGSGNITAYQSRLMACPDSTDGSVDVYLVLGDQYAVGGYTIVESDQESVYTNPTLPASQSSLPCDPATQAVFDSSYGKFAAATYTDFSGNLTINGNVKMPGTGSNMTFSDGTVQATAWNGTTLGGDYAESVDVSSDRATYEPGDVIAINPSAPGRFLKSAKPYSKLVAGVYSTKPGLVGRRTTAERPDKASEIPMAMMGIAPVKATTENGQIEVGDLLVSASQDGYAMKGTDPSRLTGAIIGKAISPLHEGTGVIEALISLQ